MLLLSLKVRKHYYDRVSWNPECWSSSLCRSWSAASHASSSTWLSSSRCSPGASLTPSNEGFSRRAQPACKCQLGPTSSGTCPTFWWPWTRQWDFWFTAWPANFFLLNWNSSGASFASCALLNVKGRCRENADGNLRPVFNLSRWRKWKLSEGGRSFCFVTVKGYLHCN